MLISFLWSVGKFLFILNYFLVARFIWQRFEDADEYFVEDNKKACVVSCLAWPILLPVIYFLEFLSIL